MSSHLAVHIEKISLKVVWATIWRKHIIVKKWYIQWAFRNRPQVLPGQQRSKTRVGIVSAFPQWSKMKSMPSLPLFSPTHKLMFVRNHTPVASDRFMLLLLACDNITRCVVTREDHTKWSRTPDQNSYFQLQVKMWFVVSTWQPVEDDSEARVSATAAGQEV